MILIYLSAAFYLLCTAVPVYALWVRPWREYRGRLMMTAAYIKEAQQRALEQQAAREWKERMKLVRDASSKIGRKVVDSTTMMGFYYRYRREETRERKRAQIQRLGLDWEILGEDFIVYRMKLPVGVRPYQVLDDRFISDLRVLVGRPDMQVIATDYDGLFLFIPLYGSRDGIPELFLWHSSRKHENALGLLPDDRPFALPVGLAPNRKFIYADPTHESDDPHILIGGTTGGGKSNLMNGFICALLSRNRPENVRFVMIDLKIVELYPYRKLEHYLWHPVINRAEIGDNNKILDVFQKLKDELLNRFDTLSSKECRSINEWNKRFPENKMYRIFVFIDELALVMQSCGTKGDSLLAQLAALGRACGVHILAFTQRPSTDVVTGLIKANFSGRIAFNCSDDHSSRTILGNSMAHGLEVRGRAIYSTQGTYTSLQTPLIYPEQIERIRNKALEYTPPPRPITRGKIIELMFCGGGVGGAKREIFELAKQENEGLTMPEFNRLMWSLHYNPTTKEPVFTLDDKKHICWGDRLLAVEKPPAANELEQLEVLA